MLPSPSLRSSARSRARPAETITGQARNRPLNEYSFAAQFAEVEVDTETGQVRVLRMVAVHDIGKAINPAAAEGQVEGGLHQGIGYALIEDMVIDPRTGRTLNPNFVDYKLLTSLDMPEMEVEFVESAGDGPYGAKGVAEDSLCPDRAGDHQRDLQRHRRPHHGIAGQPRATARRYERGFNTKAQ